MTWRLSAAADHVLDLGPGAGEEGGRLLYQGPPQGLAACADSVTAEFLQGEDAIPVPDKRRPLSHGRLRLSGATAHNLRNLTVEFPLGVLCVVTGVSGAGKSTLVEQTLYPALCRRKKKKDVPSVAAAAEVLGTEQIEDVVLMDQEPLARSARSNPATHLKIFDDIREVFADTSEARIHNFGPGAFSFNQPQGRCDVCEGQGTLTVDMQFLADVTMVCPECQGTRFKKELLNVKVRNLSIAEVLNLTVRQAFRFFRAQRNIEKRLKFLLDVGLDYLRLGQPIETLSGGECQRLKLAGHLASSRKPRCLFILLEPAVGLHPADVEQLLACFDRLLETGHSLLVVEHDLDIIKCRIMSSIWVPVRGRPEVAWWPAARRRKLPRSADSYTGQCLRKVLPHDCRLRLGKKVEETMTRCLALGIALLVTGARCRTGPGKAPSQEAGAGSAKVGPAGIDNTIAKLLTQLDNNKDGKISRDEAKGAWRRTLPSWIATRTATSIARRCGPSRKKCWPRRKVPFLDLAALAARPWTSTLSTRMPTVG